MERSDNKKRVHSRGLFRYLKTRSQACKSEFCEMKKKTGFCEMKKIWILRNEPIVNIKQR